MSISLDISVRDSRGAGVVGLNDRLGHSLLPTHITL
jgi:hypothetical protein